jgi:transposase-like protein
VNGKERTAVWRERVEAWKQSGQSRAAFAAGHGIDRWTLGRWIRRLTSDGSSASGHRDRPRDKPMTQSAPLVMEILDEASRRRRWSEEEKLRVVAETMEPAMSVSLVARRRGVSASQLFRWRRQFAGEAGMAEGGSPIAAGALRRIARLYPIEDRIRGRTADERRQIRQAEAAPQVAELKTWLEQELRRLPGRSKLAEAIRYALGRWMALCFYLNDGRVEMDTNVVERCIRPVALGRKNSLFAGSEGGGHRWAVIASLVETCKLNGVEPFAYLRDILERMVNGYPASRINELLPWNWKPAVNA